MTQEIKGYRQLSDKELELINRVKEHAEKTRDLLFEISEHIESQPETGDNVHTVTTSPSRWLSEARTDLQKGFMSLIRSIAQPTTF